MRVRVEVADTPSKLARGLMYRDQLPEDAGMLFVFPSNQHLSFWGRNTFIPLDIAFIDNAGHIKDIGKIRKLSEVAVRSRTPCLMALEVNAGFFEKHGIEVGHRILAERGDGEWIVSFDKDAGARGFDNEQQVKVSQQMSLPWTQPPIVQKAKPAPAPRPMKAVPKPKGKRLPNQMELPFTNGGQDDWLASARQQMGEQSLSKYEQGVSNDLEPQDESLPVIGLDDIKPADDDIDDKWLDDNGYQDWMDNDGAEFLDDNGEEWRPEETATDEENPDAQDMSTEQAFEYAERNGLIMVIRYTTLPKKRLSGLGGGITITRKSDAARIVDGSDDRESVGGLLGRDRQRLSSIRDQQGQRQVLHRRNI